MCNKPPPDEEPEEQDPTEPAEGPTEPAEGPTEPAESPTETPEAPPACIEPCPCVIDESFSEDGSQFIEELRQTLTDEKAYADHWIDQYDNVLNWAHDPTYDGHAQFSTVEHDQLTQRLDAVLNQCCPQGDGLLRVGNIVFHEAGTSGDAARTAVAYAWMNRAEGDATITPNTTVISDYVDFPSRLALINDTNRRDFLRNFIASMAAACARLADTNPATNDPTGGATHWVSPRSLPTPVGGVCSTDRYLRDGVCFPNWAQPNGSPVVQQYIDEGRYDSDYAEITVDGVPSNVFLFYRGVR